MKKLTLALVALVLLLPVAAMAQANGSLTVNVTVASSISLVIDKAPAGPALANGAGTSSATLTLNGVSAYGAPLAGTTVSLGTSDFTVTAPFAVKVALWNSASANYNVAAQLTSAPPAGWAWAIGTFPISNGSTTTVATNQGYGTDQVLNLGITIPQTAAAGPQISNTINLTATAN